MPSNSKSKSFSLMITAFLFIILTGCVLKHHGKPDAVIAIDLTSPGKTFPRNLYWGMMAEIKGDSIAKGGSETGNLNTALDLATKMIVMENNTDSVQKNADTSVLLKMSDLKTNKGMFVDNGRQSFYTPAFFTLKMFSENRPDKWMPVKVSFKGEDSSGKGFSVTAGTHEKSGLVIIKMVNVFNTSRHCQIVLNYKQQIKYKGEEIVMTSGNILDGNSFKAPEKVVPMTKDVNGLKNTFDYECPANAIVIIHLRYKKGINGFVDCC